MRGHGNTAFSGILGRLALFAALVAIVLVAPTAAAGTIKPDLEARLATLPPDGLLPVIVELTTQANPHAAAAAQAHSNRQARGHAVVDALRDVADRKQGAIRAQLSQDEKKGDARKVRQFWIFNGLALQATEKVIRKLAARDDVRVVRFDRTIAPPKPKPSSTPATSSADPAWNVAWVQAPDAWALGPNFNGTGVVIGSFDTGVDGTHPDLAPSYRGNNAISWFDPYGEHASPYDHHGHGTHTTGTVVGGDLSGNQIGIAPGAKWIAAKGWDDTDNATVSAFHEIFQWFLAPGGDPANAPQVVNSSWGDDEPSCDFEFRPDVQAFRAAGILPVFAAGNSGPDPETILSPGNYAESYAVGSTDFDDNSSFFSSEGPSLCTGAIKPNISAPGEFILSTWPGADYQYLDGTSMATPHVTGAAAVLLSIDPTLSVEELEAMLSLGSVDLGDPGPDNAYGDGRLNVYVSAQIALGLEIVRIVATTPTAYEAGVVPGMFTVSRFGGDNSAPLTLSYTVGGNATSGADYVALSGSVIIPSGASSATILVTPVDDNIYELDETVVVTLNPSPDYATSQPTAIVTIVSDDLPPDLIVSAMSAPATGGAGATIGVTDTTKNQGTGFAQASTTRYYLSANNVIDAGDVMLGSRAVPALGPGASNTGTVTLTIPASTAGGTYYLFTKADADDAVLENHETNNLYATNITIGADLVISAMSVPTDAGAGFAITVSDTTKNQGSGIAGASTTTYYLSADGALDPSDVVLGSRAVGALASGATDSGSISVTIPAGAAAGTYYVYAKADAANVVGEVAETNNTASRLLRIGPDLLVTTFSAPSAAGTGATITVTDTTKNQGAGAAPVSTTRYYLSTNNLFDAGDVLLGSRSVGALGPGASSVGSATLTIPASTAGGAYYLFAKADGDDTVAETQEGNNLYATTITIGADLVISALTVPSDIGAGATVTLTDTTKNQGAGAAAATTTTYYLSTDATLDASDVVLGSRAVAALGAGASDTGSLSLTIPAGTATGTYYVFAKADSAGVVSEVAETNNTTFRTLRIGPDLYIAAFSAPATSGAGATITVNETTKNQGGGAAPATTTRFYLSTNNVIDSGDVVLGSRAVAALAPGASDAAATTLTIPAGTPSGTYYLFAKADGDDALPETVESNNLYATTITLGADLVISSFSVPVSGGAGLPITFTDTTKNQGAGAAAASTTTYYLSTNSVLDAGDVALGSRSVAALAPGATDTGSATVTIPAGTATGTYYVFAMADAGGVVGEVSEVNNTAARTLIVGPDLYISAFSVPAAAGAGATITVSDTTRNQGGGTAAASNTRFYLSANNVLDAGDVLLGARAVASLAPGTASAGSTAVVIPAGTPAGTYYLFAKADGDDAVAEASESNNLYAAPITVGADLVVSALTVPASGGAGLALTITDTTKNQGAGDAPVSTTTYYLSSDAALDASDVVLGSRAIPALAAGASDTGSVTVTIPAGTATGTWYLYAKADSGGVASETSEANNATFRTIKVGPDLYVAAFSAPSSAAAGATITVNETTGNLGGGSAAASTTRYYLSFNNVLDAGDAALGGRAVAALAPGTANAGSSILTIPAGTASGFYYLFAKADGDGALAETTESNNLYAVVIQVTP